MSFLDPLWSDLAASFTATPAPVATLRLVAAMVMGGLIGFEREWHHKPAGLRTHMLISVAAALFALLSFELLEISRQLGGAETGARNDILRLIGAVTSGVAFLAAGTIVVNAGRVKGLTTGAGMWLAGAVGLACGTGRIGLAGLAAGLTVVVLWLFRRLEDAVEHKAAREAAEEAAARAEAGLLARARHPGSEAE